MSTFAALADTTFRTPQPPSIKGLWEGHVPTTLQHPPQKIQAQASTLIGFTLASMIGGGGFALHEFSPTFAGTINNSAPARIIRQKEYVLFGYEIDQSQHVAVTDYLNQHVSTADFLQGVATIIDDIYGPTTTRDLHVIEDFDTGGLIMQLTIKSGLPLDDDFDHKDQLIFQKIDSSGLAWGLRDVVITQG